MPLGGVSGGLTSAAPGAGGGAQGPQGAQGNQGTQGHQGFQGNQGTQGSTGTQGTQGNQGGAGAQGPQGTPGSGAAGAPVIRKFPFAFNTPGILTGAALYTPTVGDILLDAWIEIDTAWNGTTPFGDVGTFATIHIGVFAAAAQQAIPLNIAADATNASTDTTTGFPDVSVAGSLSLPTTNDGASLYSVALAAVNYTATPMTALSSFRVLPGRFTTTNPIKVAVSQDGTNTGADPGSTQGSAILYLVTATPT